MITRGPRAGKVAYALLLSALVHGGIGGLVGHGMIGSASIAAEPAAQTHVLNARLALADRSNASAPSDRKVDSARDAASTDIAAPMQPLAPDDTALIAVPAPYYYPAAELDRRPHPITPVTLDEPGQDMSEGYLILRLLISETGTADDVVVVLNDAQPLLVRSAREAFGRVRYAPGIKNGQPVKSQMMIEVKLDRQPA